jgi:hypothetical protein
MDVLSGDRLNLADLTHFGEETLSLFRTLLGPGFLEMGDFAAAQVPLGRPAIP